MIHPVPFESNMKNDPPPHPGEDQTAKRAKHDECPMQDDNMDAVQSPELTSADANISESQISEVVPETPLPSVPPQAQDVQMRDTHNHADTNDASGVKSPSFKDKLLNSVSQNPVEEEEDIILQKGDVSIGLNGSIPTVDFADHIIETLNKKMGLAVVVKLLGRKIGYRQLRTQLQNLWKPTSQIKLTDLDENCFLVRFQGDLDYQNALLSGPWMIYGHYLTVQPWTPSFQPHNHVINQVMGWIRLPKLPARYYHKSVIRSIGGVFGEVVRVDYNTDSGDRGKFARIAVCLDLTKPLISKIMVDGEMIFVEYEGLPAICFHCGRYGHLQEACPMLRASSSGDHTKAPLAPEPNAPTSETLEREASQFGAWMQVQRRRRPFVRRDRPNEAFDSKKVVNASRYEVLSEEVEEETSQTFAPAGDDPKVETFIRRKKGNESKGTKKMNAGTKQKAPAPQTTNQDSLFQSRHYAVRDTTSNLDPDLNKAVLIDDDRLPRRSKEGQRSHYGPNGQIYDKAKPNNGNDPLSKSRDF
ncbi:hypothetical protein K1719_023797 [Acacia pycnantha]|nr:hypothetical protein K1719_023797 [Acacia pycnantha]